MVSEWLGSEGIGYTATCTASSSGLYLSILSYLPTAVYCKGNFGYM